MQKLIIPIVSLAVLAACGETTTQRTATGATGGAVAGAVVGGPVGAVVGAGVGAVAGANREKIDEGTDKATDATKEKVAEATDSDKSGAKTTRMRSADRIGPTNAQVESAQTALHKMDLYEGKIDGIYGPQTIKAVRQFQSVHGLAQTGTLNGKTREELQQQASAAGTMGNSGSNDPSSTPSNMRSSEPEAPDTQNREQQETPAATQNPTTPSQ